MKLDRAVARSAVDSMTTRDAVFWFDRKAEALPRLRQTVHADVVVVGGGMMGLMCARSLAARKQRVCVLEADTCGGGASGRSSGLITPDSELELTDLVRGFGTQDGPRLWDFASAGVSLIRQAIVDDCIDCDMQPHDALFVAATRSGAELIAAEFSARQSFGYPCQHCSQEQLPDIMASSAYYGALRFGGTFSIDGYRCCVGLRQRLIEAGTRIFEHSVVTRVVADGVETAEGFVQAPVAIVCTDRLLPDLGLAKREIYHAQTFLAISERLADSDVECLFPRDTFMVWDTDLFYKYFRLTGDRRLLIGGSTLADTYSRRERHDPEQVVRRLTKYLAQRFPRLAVRFAACWPGLIGITKDFAPIVGRHPRFPAVYFGGGAAGLPWAAALGRYLGEKVLDGRSDLEDVLGVERRFPVGRRLQAVLGAPAAFAVSHGILKFLRK
jgi:gamma-glutamylputrescine oxidase